MKESAETTDILKKYFSGVVERSEHHANNVNKIIYPLLGVIIRFYDEDEGIKLLSREGNLKNVLWFSKNNKPFTLAYDHKKECIDIRDKSLHGKVIHSLTNSTTIDELLDIFESL